MSFAPRPSRPPRSRGRGGFRGSRRGTSGHFPTARGAGGRGRGFSSSYAPRARSPSRSFNVATSVRNTYSELQASSSSSRRYEEPVEKYQPDYRSSSRDDYRPKYSRESSQDYYKPESTYRAEAPRRKTPSDYRYETEEPSQRSRSSGGLSFRAEERFERDYYGAESSREQLSPEPERFLTSSRELYLEEVAPPPPLLSQEYVPMPKPLVHKRGRGSARGRAGFSSRGVSRGGLPMKNKSALAAHKRFLLEKIKRSKINTMQLEKAQQNLEGSLSPIGAGYSGAMEFGSDEELTRNDVSDDELGASPSKKSRYDGRPPPRRHFITLICPHCKENCTTFRQYEMHLLKKRHIASMTKVALRTKQQVIKMRTIQRKQQNEEEGKVGPDEPLTDFTQFCPICKLNYRQTKTVHSKSKSHIDMKKFLFPVCKVCHISFKSTRMYEHHLCSLEHIKAASYSREREEKEKDSDVEGGIDEEALNCLEGFMVVDSVGEDDDENSAEKAEVLCGMDRIKLVEAQFCELCQRFLPRLDDIEKAKAVHCRSYLHKKNYSYETRKAARMSSKRREEKEEVKKDVKDGNDKKEESKVTQAEESKTKKEEVEKEENVDDDDEVIWGEVDNDISELLKERDESNSNDTS